MTRTRPVPAPSSVRQATWLPSRPRRGPRRRSPRSISSALTRPL
jgi:hypothetical protein